MHVIELDKFRGGLEYTVRPDKPGELDRFDPAGFLRELARDLRATAERTANRGKAKDRKAAFLAKAEHLQRCADLTRFEVTTAPATAVQAEGYRIAIPGLQGY